MCLKPLNYEWTITFARVKLPIYVLHSPRQLGAASDRRSYHSSRMKADASQAEITSSNWPCLTMGSIKTFLSPK